MWFVYDATGAPLGLTYNGTPYYYVTNLQGDITGLTNASGTLIAQYTYDPWGKPLTVTDANGTDISANATHIANINPLRYRGYYYDTESGLYYLLSRYYDPVTQRFINADGYVSTGTGILGFNMFAYCINNPVNLRDSAGSRPIVSTSTQKETEDDRKLAFDSYNDQLKQPQAVKVVSSGQSVFIVSPNEDASSISNGIVVIDKRQSENPSMQIVESYKIKDPIIQREILMALDQYEKSNPTDWNRNEDIDDMQREWVGHNQLYPFFALLSLDEQAESTKHVDLDNEDKEWSTWREFRERVIPW